MEEIMEKKYYFKKDKPVVQAAFLCLGVFCIFAVLFLGIGYLLYINGAKF